MDKYCLPDNYQHRINNGFFDDTPYTDEYQDKVYNIAFYWGKLKEYSSVLDIGTGSGFKLMKYFKDYKTFGIDIGSTVDFLKEKYPERSWGEVGEAENKHDLIICSDVIEHIPDADDLIKTILSFDFKTIMISTPDRDSLYPNTLGKPSNPAHVREWTMDEFNCYLSKYFYVIRHRKLEPNTQYAICRKK